MTDQLNDQDLFDKLTDLNIKTKTVDHEPAFTVEQAQALRGNLEGGHIKNLFLRDKKKNIWLCTVLEDREVNLKALKTALEARGNLSFGSADLLMECLGVIPGAVTPFGPINDHQGRVTVVLDQGLLAFDTVNAHPLRNDQTTQIATKDLLTFLDAVGHPPIMLDFNALPSQPE